MALCPLPPSPKTRRSRAKTKQPHAPPPPVRGGEGGREPSNAPPPPSPPKPTLDPRFGSAKSNLNRCPPPRPPKWGPPRPPALTYRPLTHEPWAWPTTIGSPTRHLTVLTTKPAVTSPTAKRRPRAETGPCDRRRAAGLLVFTTGHDVCSRRSDAWRCVCLLSSNRRNVGHLGTTGRMQAQEALRGPHDCNI